MTRWLWDSSSPSFFYHLWTISTLNFVASSFQICWKSTGLKYSVILGKETYSSLSREGLASKWQKGLWKNGLIRGKLIMKVPLMTKLLLDHCWLQRNAQPSRMVFGVSFNLVPTCFSNSPHPLLWVHRVPCSPNFLQLPISTEKTSQTTLSSHYCGQMHKHTL